MLNLLCDFLLCASLASLAAAFGWWLRGSDASRRRGNTDADAPADESSRAQEALGHLQDLAAAVAAEVGAHNQRVEEINEELSGAEGRSAEGVVAAVAKLIESNKAMQAKLATAEDRLEEQARQIQSHAAEARTDPLTQLANRRAFDAELQRLGEEFQRSGRPFCVVMLDVDHFKKFNDTHGHKAGDEVLKGVARTLRNSARGGDLVARYGGEEFVVLMSGATLEEACAGVERYRRAIDNARFFYQGAELHVTCSLGLSQGQPTESGEETVERADKALYASKQAGRNCGHWHDGMQTIAIAKTDAPPAPIAKPDVDLASPDPQPAANEPAHGEDREPAAPAGDDPLTDPQNPATKLLSRTVFCSILNNRLAEWRRGGAPPGVALIQVDGYPALLARFGPPVAEQVLRTAERLIGVSIREMDSLAQYDDATFALLVPGANIVNISALGERIRLAVSHSSLPIQGRQLRFSVSGGVAQAQGEENIEQFLRRTEHALEAALAVGRNTTYCHNGSWSEPADRILQRTATEADVAD